MKKLNNNNLDVYLFIKKYIDENGFSPSYREIKDGTNYKSVVSVFDVVQKLEELKFLKAKRNEKGNILPRSIRIIEDNNTKKQIQELREKYKEN